MSEIAKLAAIDTACAAATSKFAKLSRIEARLKLFEGPAGSRSSPRRSKLESSETNQWKPARPGSGALSRRE